ncbi:hypothetical protein [Persephonella sp.]
MGLKNIGQNSAQEFFETLIYLTAYNESLDIIKNYTKDIDNPVLREAVEDSLNVLTFGLIFYLIQTEEKFLERIFNLANSFVVFLLSPIGKYKKKIKTRGIKGIFNALLGRFSSSDRIALSNVVVSQTSNLILARSNSYKSNSLYKSYSDTKNNIYMRENLHLNLSSNYSRQYIESLLFKMFTSSFTPNDEMLLKKILGTTNISIDDINKVSEFLFVKDDTGKVVGLSEAFFRLVNGLGYIHRG